MNLSTKFEKRVIVQTYQPTAASLMAVLNEHDRDTDTMLSEWKVEIERKTNEVTHSMMVPGNKYRWEITLTRSIT